MTSRELATISRSDLDSLVSASATARITEFKQLASYSWCDKPTATISVPGSPPLWSPPPKSSLPLDPDSGTVYIDQNAARCPWSPLEPLFRALFIMNPDLDLSDVDVVTDRNNIRKLLRFVQASSSDPFRIRVEAVAGRGDGRKGTALFTRADPESVETIVGFKGYARNFEKAYTKKRGGIGTTGYHRIVGYNFGGLRCVVRCEADGYVGDESADDGLLSAAVRGLSLGSSSESQETTTATGLTILTSGHKEDVDVSSTIEIKTRAASRTLDMDEAYGQLWVSQTPKLAVGYHRRGVFTDVQVRDVAGDLARWEAVNRRPLEKLAGLLARIIDVAKQTGGSGRAVVEYTGGSSLRIVADDNGQPALPKDLYAKWANEPAQLGETPAQDSGKVKCGNLTTKEEVSKLLIPAGTPFASDMEYAIQKGPRQFFVRLPGNISDYHLVCQQLKSLPVETLDKVLKGWSFTLKEIMADFQKGKEDWDPEERQTIGGFKTVARDAAFRLVYMLLSGQAEAQDKAMAYNAAFFVVSHSRIFGVRTRQMVRAAFDDRFSETPKQRAMMDQWTKAWPIEDVSGENETTDDEPFYSSDDSDYW
ncbi:hypothetical protein QBC42DRAFT_271706 [Cladorrhinum samala]|uniref:Decapping nuclease n=1 Tax=Cladorrhinum samala TaxID=585594 RepID=A0AAV9HK58_9PEZI|nr:hypothetical protein QBC42DRAFT_271706 [Cladorrhinum samala]